MSRLRELRLERHLTQEDMARRTGLTVTGYRQIEIGEVDPKLTSVQAIACALDLAVEDIWPPGSLQEETAQV